MFPSALNFGSSNFGASTFFASAHPNESCGSNGLPLTPNSIRILGCARELYHINHPNLCTYIDVQRGKHERIMVVQEYHKLNLKNGLIKYKYLHNEEIILRFFYEILEGLVNLNSFGTVCRNLTPENILLTPKASVKLYNYGLYYMTEAGTTVTFPIGTPKYLPPELLIGDFLNDGSVAAISSHKGHPAWDTWSLGIIFLEMLLGETFFSSSSIEDIVIKILTISMNEKDFVSELLDYCGCSSKLEAISESYLDLIRACLNVDLNLRPLPSELLHHRAFSFIDFSSRTLNNNLVPHFPCIDPSLCLPQSAADKAADEVVEEHFRDAIPNYPHGRENLSTEVNKKWSFAEIDHMRLLPIRLVYHLWQLVGGNIEVELKRQKLIHVSPSVLILPNIIVTEGEMFGGGFERYEQLPTDTIILPLTNLANRLANISADKFYPLITKEEYFAEGLETSKLPLVIRERDVEYQFHRLILFQRLLKAYPYKYDLIFREARRDIPPLLRAFVWAALLRIDGDVADQYELIDKTTPTSTDRQIEVDIPRCHQYDELLSSPRGHAKFTRILKAWVASHPHLVYWQGLDSLCAPFLYLNFENEALAFSCLRKFISKYLRGFFLRDNSAVIQEYLAVFSQLIAFHEPHLFNHMHTIGFIPDLYAIPWFLTMFTHVFPLHKIFLLWDTLLLGGSSLPLCVGVALLRQLKDRLLQFGFNECILLFSDMPDIAMERVVRDAVDLFCATPDSLTRRQHGDGINESTDKDKQPALYDDDLSKVGVPLAELKRELCGRVSGADVASLMEGSVTGKTKMIAIDIRNSDEYSKGALAGSVCAPYDSLVETDDEGALQPTSFLRDFSVAAKGKILVVIGSNGNHDQVLKISEMFLLEGFPRVCILHKGIEVFRASGHLIVPF